MIRSLHHTIVRSILCFSLLYFFLHSYTQETYVYSNRNLEFYAFDIKNCTKTFLFKLKFPEYITERRKFISGITFTPSGEIYGVGGNYLFKIDPENESLSILDSIGYNQYGDPRWICITSSNDGFLYMGAWAIYVYDPLQGRFIVQPASDNERENFFVSDFTLFDNELISFNSWQLRMDYLSFRDIKYTRKIPIEMQNEITLHSFAAYKTGCNDYDLYGFDYTRHDTSQFYQIDEIERKYALRCEVRDSFLSGGANPMIFNGKPLAVDGENITYDHLGHYEITLTDSCYQTVFADATLRITMCYPVDSIVFKGPGTMEIQGLTDAALFARKYRWVNHNNLTDLDINRMFDDLNFKYLGSPGDYEIIIQLWSQSAMTRFTLLISPGERNCEVPASEGIFLPSAFSPNGDGTNDQYEIFTASYINLNSVTIYDRWGNQCIRTQDELFNWNGGDYPTGVYVCHVIYYDHLRNAKLNKTSEIILIR